MSLGLFEVGEQKEGQGSLVQQVEMLHRVACDMGNRPMHYMCLVDSSGVPQIVQVLPHHSYHLHFYPFL